mmetsp:Transcript_12046/g.21414  ORF Transcript_12046/g.21414 Transcript_12046/m.21414 type:complete len:89 (-) Transcript_12046:34-300(-)
MNQVGGRDHNGNGFRFDCHDNYRDAALLGPCDDAVRTLCDELGWRDELEALIAAGNGEAVEGGAGDGAATTAAAAAAACRGLSILVGI